MDPRLLRSFVAVAEELHFGRAARRLHLSQPPLSVHVKRLEAELGVTLLARTRRRVALTEAGAVLLARARHLLAEGERAAAEVARVGRGEGGALAVGYAASATYEVLPRLVAAHRAEARGVRLDLVELRSPLQPDALREGRIEVGLVCAPVPAAGLVEHPLLRERPVAILPAGHRLARRPAVRAAELAREPFVAVHPDVEPGWAHAAATAFHRAGLGTEVVQETDTKLAMLGLVAAGLGVSIGSRSMACLGREGVVLRPLVGISLEFPLAVLAPAALSPRAAAFVALARRVFSGAVEGKRAARGA